MIVSVFDLRYVFGRSVFVGLTCTPLIIPQSEGKMPKRLGGIVGCKYNTSSWHLNGFPDGVTLGQQYNTGEKPTVMLYTYINRHVGTTDKNKTKTLLVHNKIGLY